MASRALRVHCFWYEPAVSALVLRMNPANARSRHRAAPSPHEGSEYLVILHDDRVRIADGRTRSAADVVACARAWIAGVDLDQLVREVPFVDEKARAMRALAERLDPQLRWEIGEEPANELWVYGDGHSCRVAAGDDGVMSCSFLLGQAQVAHAAASGEVPRAVAAWLVDRLSVRMLATSVTGVDLERHAEVLETDPARWHWLHLRERIADPRDVLAPLRGLIERLAVSPVVTTFYSYSSLDRLCFSASSHYPWVDDGLPVVAPDSDGTYVVDGSRCDSGRAMLLIESRLAASPLRPFFGSAPHRELPLLVQCLAKQGSALLPRLEQHGAWYELVVPEAEGARRCKVSARRVTFIDATGRLDATWPTLEEAAGAIRRYCEAGASRDELAADPRARHVFESAPRG